MAALGDDLSSSSSKKKYKKNRIQNLLGGRSRRRINSADSSSAPNGERAFLRSASVSVTVHKFSIDSNDNEEADNEEELDFLDMLGKLQSSRLDDQRTSLPSSLSQNETLVESNEDLTYLSAPRTKEIRNMEPIMQVLSLGSPYPLVVLPVEGDFWMEGTNHILQKDMYNRPTIPKVDLSKCIVESDETAIAYRENYLGREHLNYTAIDNKYGPMILSLKCETNVFGDGNHNDSKDYFEVILRLKDRTIHQFLPSSSLSENPRPREIIQSILQDELDVERFHPVAVPRISEHIVKYDEHVLTSCYKIGVIYQKHGQTTEEEYFGNKAHGSGMTEFLNCIGQRVQLQGFEGYRGGLDVKYNQTGEHSYHTVFKNREFMFHVSTLLPYTVGDVQQVQRKRHIGNDIVAIVFQDENTPFCPTSVRSHFLHVFIVVQVVDANTPNVKYKVSVTARDGVPNFGPRLPNPAVFRKGKEFREFLMTKILNAELAACKSERFSQLADRTRGILLQQLVSDLILKNEHVLEEGESQLNRTFSGGKGSILSSFRSALGNSKTRNGSSQSLNVNLASKNGLSLSLNDIADTCEEGKKEKKKLFSKGRSSKDHSREQERKESKSAAVSPTSPCNTWPNTSSSMSNTENPLVIRAQSIENCQPKIVQHPNYQFESGESGNSSPALSNYRLSLNFHPDMSNRLDSGLSSDGRYTKTSRSDSYDEARMRHVDPRLNSNYLSVSSCSSSFEDVSTSSACSALDAAQREIEILRSEISKLKTDKMDLVRQNVVYQREIRRFKERSLHQTAQLYSVQHELAKLRMLQKGEDIVNHNTDASGHVPDLDDTEKTPVNHDTDKNHKELMISHSEMTPVRQNPKNGYRPSRGAMRYDAQTSHQNHRHSISHV